MNSTNATNYTESAAANSTTFISLIDVDANETSCSLCPNGLALPDPSRRFINVADGALDCGGLDDLFQMLGNPESCERTKLAFNATFDPAIYCHCPVVRPTGICKLCPETGILFPDSFVNDVRCSDYGSLAAGAITTEFCQSILDVEGIDEICCQAANTTTPQIDVDGIYAPGEDVFRVHEGLKADSQSGKDGAQFVSPQRAIESTAVRPQPLLLTCILFLAHFFN